MSSAAQVVKQVERDQKRFKLLFTNSRVKIPADYSAPLGTQPTRVLIGQRIRATAPAPAAESENQACR